jgi:hypothetical protein
MRLRQISLQQLKEEVDLALWELDLGDEPESVVRRLLMRMRRQCDSRPHGGLRFRLRMLLRRDRGGIQWD